MFILYFSYMLRSGTCVNASKINFKHRLVDKNIKEVCIYAITAYCTEGEQHYFLLNDILG